MDIDYKHFECDTMSFVKGDGVVKTFPVIFSGTRDGINGGEFEQIPLDQLEKLGEECAKAIFKENK